MDKPVENVENFEFSTGISAVNKFTALVDKPVETVEKFRCLCTLFHRQGIPVSTDYCPETGGKVELPPK